MKKVKFAFIGCGKIAHYHADVVKHLGHNIDTIVARSNSRNIDVFAEKYRIKKKFHDVNSFLEDFNSFKDAIDCILVCTPWDVTEKILRQLLPLGLPIMSEKPAVLSLNRFKELKKMAGIKNLFVAYNRRFYDFIPLLEKMVRDEHPICVDILSAEPCEMIIKVQGKRVAKYMPYFYTSHIIDLILYLFKRIEIKSIVRIPQGRKKSWICELSVGNQRIPLQMKILMDSPQNSYLRVFFRKKVAELCPLEKMTIYDKLEKKELENKAVYLPSKQMELETDDKFKPGFLKEMRYFIDNFVIKRNRSCEHIVLLEKVTSFCYALLKS